MYIVSPDSSDASQVAIGASNVDSSHTKASLGAAVATNVTACLDEVAATASSYDDTVTTHALDSFEDNPVAAKFECRSRKANATSARFPRSFTGSNWDRLQVASSRRVVRLARTAARTDDCRASKLTHNVKNVLQWLTSVALGVLKWIRYAKLSFRVSLTAGRYRRTSATISVL
mmetsp:Transcript_19937/g.33154  ORF Transcript_19937/g.33154 Transcript_19937/m.33154 type:complete len:174 (-) Transcript_19937:354-875(-)